MLIRPQWPHTIEDITKSLEGVWGLVGATGTNGNLYRLERSLHEPLVYTLTEYKGNEESDVIRRDVFEGGKRDEAVKAFAKAIGFTVS
ncbi:MAG TPA: hypothetical protein V6D17_02425 [Candidatus Obscuribacterales bacterium]